jgi:hypothetical protein
MALTSSRVRERDLIAGALRVIHLPGKSAGEIGLFFTQRPNWGQHPFACRKRSWEFCSSFTIA